MKFEEALEKLESVVDSISNDNTSLEDSLKKYEEGIKYYKICSKILEEANQKIEVYERDIKDE